MVEKIKSKEIILELIENGYECDYLDFKKVQYNREKYGDLIVDIMSMANSNFAGDKYILVGIKDKPNGERELVGIEPTEFIDDSIYQNLIFDNIEPEIKFEYYSVEIQEKLIGVFKIQSINTDRPYMMKKKYNNLHEGLSKIRRGSTNSFITRKDIEKFYTDMEKFQVQFMDDALDATYDEIGCARTSITIRNYTKFPVVINYGLLTVYNKQGKALTEHRVYGFEDKIIGADFHYTLPLMTEKLGNLYVRFSSTDCLKLGLDEYGSTDEFFNFELLLIDTNENEYITYFEDGWIFAKGKFLWKVELAVKKERNRGKKGFLYEILKRL